MKSAHSIIWHGSLLPVAAERFLFNQMRVSDQLVQVFEFIFWRIPPGCSRMLLNQAME